MKTRIIFTKIWEDDFFYNLTANQKLLFIYYLTNSLIGLTGIYELSDRRVRFDTGLDQDEIDRAKQIFEANRKIAFKDGWVYIINSQKMNGYHGEKLDPAVEKEKFLIPVGIQTYFKAFDLVEMDRVSDFSDRVSIPLKTINNKSKIINHKSEDIKGAMFEEELKKEVVGGYEIVDGKARLLEETN